MQLPLRDTGPGDCFIEYLINCIIFIPGTILGIHILLSTFIIYTDFKRPTTTRTKCLGLVLQQKNWKTIIGIIWIITFVREEIQILF